MYDVINKSSDWWFARLARDTGTDGKIGRQGWVPSSFLDKFTQSLTPEEETAYTAGIIEYSSMYLTHYICTVLLFL